MESKSESLSNYYVLITGANTGLGYAICCRLIDEFLATRGRQSTLVLVFTTRDRNKGDATRQKLSGYFREALTRVNFQTPPSHLPVVFQPETVELTSLISVKRLAIRLLGSLPRLDVVILNAGIGGWSGLDWRKAIPEMLFGFVTAVTWPTFKVGKKGWLANRQLLIEKEQVHAEPPIGEVFCANVFGHYVLVHYLALLYSRTSQSRIIWLSTLDAHASTFSLSDFQAIDSSCAYESTKRLTDILTLTAALPSTQAWTNTFFASHITGTEEKETRSTQNTPAMYVTQPGVCVTAIMVKSPVLMVAYWIGLYLARLLGSIWHTCTPYKGACAPVWIALASQDTLDSYNKSGGLSKWGSATDVFGNERAERTEVEGWGYGGTLEEIGKNEGKKGRPPWAKDVTREGREEFEELGRKCWSEMERLRIEWEERIDAAYPNEDHV